MNQNRNNCQKETRTKENPVKISLILELLKHILIGHKKVQAGTENLKELLFTLVDKIGMTFDVKSNKKIASFKQLKKNIRST